MSGKGKGSQFERDIAKFLTKWLTEKYKPYAFWRTPLSGGLATISELNSHLSGDIVGLTPEAKEICNVFSMELKNGYPNTSFWQHFKGIKNFNIENFWKQCIGDANKGNKLPMLIYRKKGKKEIVGINTNTNNILKSIEKEFFHLRSISMSFPYDDMDDIILYDMKAFFEILNKDMVIKVGKELCQK